MGCPPPHDPARGKNVDSESNYSNQKPRIRNRLETRIGDQVLSIRKLLEMSPKPAPDSNWKPTILGSETAREESDTKGQLGIANLESAKWEPWEKGLDQCLVFTGAKYTRTWRGRPREEGGSHGVVRDTETGAYQASVEAPHVSRIRSSPCYT